MDPEAAVEFLKNALQDPAQAHRHAEIQAALNKFPSHEIPVGVRAPDEAEYIPPPATFGERMRSGYERVKGGIDLAGRAANRFADTATLGAYGAATRGLSRATHLPVGTQPAQAAEFERDHPWAAGAVDAGAYLTGEALPARLGKAIGRGVDELTSALARRGLTNTTAPGRIATRTLGSAATGAGTAAVTRGAEALSRGQEPTEAFDEAAAAAKWGGLFGAGIGAAGGGAAEVASAARASNPDLAILHRHGLEPGPVPGRAVIRQDMPISRQLPGGDEPPPLGVSRATPGTRGEAARRAADVILPDMSSRSAANNQRFGEWQRQTYAAEGANPAPATPALQLIDQHLRDLSLSPPTRAALEDLRAQIVGNGTSTRAGHFLKAMHLDQLRDYADKVSRQGKAAGVDDVPMRQVADVMRAGVAEAAPGVAHLNALQHDVLTGFERRRELMGLPKTGDRVMGARAAANGEEPDLSGEVTGADLQDIEQGRVPNERLARATAQRLRQGGEETATAGAGTTAEGTANERLARLGPPTVLPGTRGRSLWSDAAGFGPEPNYGAHLEVPRLQLAQENIQLSASKNFSGARSAGERGLVFRAIQFAPTRLGYPLVRRAGDSAVAAKPLAADALVHALRNRRRDRTNQEGAP